MLLSKKSTVRSSGNDTRITLCRRSVRIPRETLRFSTPLPFPAATLRTAPPPRSSPCPQPSDRTRFVVSICMLLDQLVLLGRGAAASAGGGASERGAHKCAPALRGRAAARDARAWARRPRRRWSWLGAAFEIARRAGGGAGEAVGESWVVESLVRDAGSGAVDLEGPHPRSDVPKTPHPPYHCVHTAYIPPFGCAPHPPRPDTA